MTHRRVAWGMPYTAAPHAMTTPMRAAPEPSGRVELPDTSRRVAGAATIPITNTLTKMWVMFYRLMKYSD